MDHVMSNTLAAFAHCIEEHLKSVDHESHWTPDEAARYMAAVAARRERFDQDAASLIADVVRPYLATLAGYFPQASLLNDQPPAHCGCWFGYCERFPVSAKIAFAIEHDVRFEKVAICYEVSMAPQFFKLNERDRLTLTLDGLDNTTVANWVEQRLLEFLDDYLRLDRGRADFDEDFVTDPVCGMRIARSEIVASSIYRGHPYFFCSRECQEEFVRSPAVYVEVKAI